MKRKEAEKLYHLNREIWQDRRRLREMEAVCIDSTASISGLPHIDPVRDRQSIEIIQKEINKKIIQSVKYYLEIMAFIDSVPDSRTRQLLSLRCLDGLSWDRVALEMGGGNTAEGVRKAFFRFFIAI